MKFFLLFFLFYFACFFYSKDKENTIFLYILYYKTSEEGNFNKAKEYLEKLLEIKKERELYIEYIFLLYKMKEYSKLKRVFLDFQKKFSVDSTVVYPFLSACVFTGDYKNFKKFEKIFRDKFKKDKSLLYLTFSLYQSIGEYNEALSILDELIKIDSNNLARYLLDKARTLSLKKEFKRALEIIEILEKKETIPEVLLEKAICYEGLNNTKEALKVYRKLIDYPGIESKNLLKRIINLAISNGDYELTDSLLKDRIEDYFYDIDLIEQYGFIKYIKNELKESVKFFSLALTYNPNSDLAHYYLSRIFYKEKHMEKAFYHIKKAIEINPKSSEYYIYYAFLLITEGKLDEAQSVLREIKDKNTPSYFYLSGFLERKKGKLKRAIYLYEKALKLDSLDANKWFEAGAIYADLNEIKKASRAFKKSVQLDTTFSEAYNYWGYMLAERGLKLDTAKILIEKALKYEPENGYYLDSMGWVYYMMGKYDTAYIYLKKAAEYVPNDPVIIEHLGDVYFKLNQIEKALTYWQKALKLSPNNKNLKKKIKKYKGKRG
ncbi:MAG: tetratricopeptide repeat protein [Candidatus Hydrothermales bacterium]